MQISPEKLKYFRKNNGWSQDVLAKAAGVSLRTVQRVEKEGNASSETLLSLASALSKSPKELCQISQNIETFWKWRNIMQNCIALIVVTCAVSMLLVLGGDIGIFTDFYGILFLLLFMYACSVFSFGSHGMIKSITGLHLLFSSEITPTKAVEQLVFIYKKQITFIYAGAFIGLIVGAISILSSPEAIESRTHFFAAWAVNMLIILYAAILAEAILRPLATKLESTKLNALQ